MPITLRCPHCGAKITARPFPTGKPITCAKCERKFTPPDDDDEPEVDDESPRPRRRDDDDEIDRPRNRKGRRGKRKKTKRGNPLRVILPLAGLALFVGVGLVVCLVVFRPFSRDAGGNPGVAAKDLPDSDLLAWAPADSSDVYFINHRAVAYLQTAHWNPYQLAQLVPSGLDPNDVDAAVLAGRPGGMEGVYVVRLKNPNAEGIDQAMARQGGRPKQIGSQTIYEARGYTMYRASDRILVASDRRGYIEDRIRSNPSRILIGGSVLDYVSRASADAWSVRVVNAAVLSYRINGFPALSSLAMLQVREDGVLFTSDITYTDSDTASQAVARERAAEVRQTGPRVVYRLPGSTAAGGLGLGIVEWRWRW
jgi:hypothetical protein